MSTANCISLITSGCLLLTLVALSLRRGADTIGARAPLKMGRGTPSVSGALRARSLPAGMFRSSARGLKAGSSAVVDTTKYSDPNQKRRFATAKEENNQRVLDIESVYQGSKLKGKVALITGANRGLGLQIAKEMISQGAKVIGTTRSSPPPEDCNFYKVIEGIDVTKEESMKKLAEELKGEKIDILVNNAGYFMKEPETLDNLHFDEQIKMIDICALGPLRTTAALVNNGLMAEGASIATITSQGGSVTWRDVQNEGGPYDYGHHMSKCAANMMGKLMAIELKGKGYKVIMLHPGFNKTKMTEKYKDIWEEEGAVDPAIGAKRVCHEIIQIDDKETHGKFINCEDGLEIPW